MNFLTKTTSTLVGLFSVHWIAIQVYSRYCAPPGVWGFVSSLVSSPSSVCIALNYIQFYSIDYYYKTWIAVSAITFTYISGLLKNTRCHKCDDVSNKEKEYHIQTRSMTSR